MATAPLQPDKLPKPELILNFFKYEILFFYVLFTNIIMSESLITFCITGKNIEPS